MDLFDLEQSLNIFSQDISEAFDLFSRIIKCLAIGRLGVPEENTGKYESINSGSKRVVVTTYDTSKDVIGDEGTFECLRRPTR